MMRSTFSSPLGLSNSYFTLEPSGISITAWKSRGSSSPGETSCQAWSISAHPSTGVSKIAAIYYRRKVPSRQKSKGARSLMHCKVAAQAERALGSGLLNHFVPDAFGFQDEL